MDNLSAVINALAVHRLTKLVVDDEILDGPRTKFFDKYPPSESKLGYLPTCVWCTSFWAGVAVVTAEAVAPKAWRPLSYALAFSSITGLIEEIR